MEIQIRRGDITRIKTEAICLGIFRGVRAPGGAAGAVDRTLNGALRSVLRDGDVEGNKGETFLVRTHGEIPAKRVLLVGLGEPEKFNLEGVREASAIAARAASRFAEVTTVVHGAGLGGLPADTAAQAVVGGTLSGSL